jgi:hypothetical protein
MKSLGCLVFMNETIHSEEKMQFNFLLEANSKMVFMQKAAVNVMLRPPQADEASMTSKLCTFKVCHRHGFSPRDAFGILPPQSSGIRMDNDLAVFIQEDTIQSF